MGDAHCCLVVEKCEHFSILLHKNLYVQQFFPVGFGPLFARDFPEVLPDFFVQGVDFGGLRIGDDACCGIVHGYSSLRTCE